MITPSEIGGLMKACARPTLRIEILQIVDGAGEPMCCQDIYKKSALAPDSMTLSREVHLMTATVGLLEVAEKKPREGFREVSFYRLTEAGRRQLEISGEQMQPATAKVQPNTSTPITPFIKETTMPQKQTPDRSGKLRTFLLDLIIKQPGISKASLIEYAQAEFPDTEKDRICQTLGNLVTGKHIKGEGKRGSVTYRVIGAAAPSPASAPPQAPAGKVKNKPQKKSAAQKPAAVPAPMTAKYPAAFDPEYSFAFGVRKDGGVAICKDGVSITLTRHEVQTINDHTTQE